MAGCIRALSGRDDLIDKIFSSRLGQKAFNLAVRGECRIVLALPELQRYSMNHWTGMIRGMRIGWALEHSQCNVQDGRMPAGHLRRTVHGLNAVARMAVAARTGVASDRAESVMIPPSCSPSAWMPSAQNEASPWPELVRSAVGTPPITPPPSPPEISIGANGATTQRQSGSMISNIIARNPFLLYPLNILVCPLVGLWPPLQRLGEQSDYWLLRTLSMPPSLRFYLFEATNLTFVILLTVTPLPVLRQAPSMSRDWMFVVAAISQLAKVSEFIWKLGVRFFFRDPHNWVELLSAMCTLAACVLNVCNSADWPWGPRGAETPENVPADFFDQVGYLWQFCSSTTNAPLAGREYLALAVSLRWINLIPRLAQRSQLVGPIVLSLRKMLKDVLVWVLLSGWVVVTFASFFRALNAEPYGTATALPEGCINPDKDFEDYGTTLRVLFESGITGESHFECFRAASTSTLGLPAAYAYIVFSVIVLTNMLCAH